MAEPAGRWVIRDGSEAGYRVREKLARLPAASEAAGRTEGVSGGFRVTGQGGRYSVTGIEVEVDMAGLTSDSPRRDQTLRERGLQTDRFPTASFRSPGPVEIPDDLRSGEATDFRIDGALTIHGVTRQVSIPIRARLRSELLEVVGSLTMHMADFGIEPPNVANIVSVEPTGTMEFRLVLEKAA
jgi:polyisoprenoid-binding protein YceI